MKFLLSSDRGAESNLASIVALLLVIFLEQRYSYHVTHGYGLSIMRINRITGTVERYYPKTGWSEMSNRYE